MALITQENTGGLTSQHTATALPRLQWKRIIAMSIFWFALNFHWSALGLIILPSQVVHLVGDAHKGEALAFVLIPGAFVSLVANPLFGWLSDQTHGYMDRWGRRRPYILIGTLVNIGGLIWMATATNLASLALAYILVQLASNAAQAPFHALLPDMTPREQRGAVSGIMGVLWITGNIVGVVFAGVLIDASKPFPIYQQELWTTYGIISAVLFALMLMTILSVRERRSVLSKQHIARNRVTMPSLGRGHHLMRLNSSFLVTLGATIAATALVWGVLLLWNWSHIGHMQISNEVQQVILELVVTLGILRVFDFNPRRYPDFAWVLVTRFLMMMGIYTIQNYVQYYMRDVVAVPHPEMETARFLIIGALSSVVSAFAAGWLSDRIGRKRLTYFSGGLVTLLSFIVIITHMFTRSAEIILPLLSLAGLLFGIGYGAYQSVDWALVADVLPSHKSYAKDMGVWNISFSLPQVIVPVMAGPMIDTWTQHGMPVVGYQLLFALAAFYCLIGTVAVRFIRGNGRL